MIKSSLLLCISAAAALAGCHRNPSPLDGQWNLDESQSHAAAPAFTIAVSPEGVYHVDDGAIDLSFRCDGNLYPTVNGTGAFISCTQNDPKTLVLKKNTNGPDSTNTRWELSDDGKTLITVDKLIQIDGSMKVSSSSGPAIRDHTASPVAGKPQIPSTLARKWWS